MNIKKAFRAVIQALEAMEEREEDIEQRLKDLETAVGDLQGTKEITDVPLTDKLIENEIHYTFTLPLPGTNPYDFITGVVIRDIQQEQELAAQERFNIRFENLPEQGGPYDD